MSRELQAKCLAALFVAATVVLLVMIAWDMGSRGAAPSMAEAARLLR